MSGLYYDPDEVVQEDPNYLFNLLLEYHQHLLIIEKGTQKKDREKKV